MIILNINGKKYKLPTLAKEINYKIGKEIDNIIKEYPEMSIEGKKWILASLIGVEYDVIDLITDEQIELIMDNHVMFNTELIINQDKYIKIDGVLYEYKNNDSMIVDEYAQKELCVVNEDFEDLFFSLYEKVKWYNKPLYRLLSKNHKTIENINYFQFKLSIYLYLEWKNRLLNEYAVSTNNDNIPQEQQDDDYKLSGVEKFGVYHIIMTITNGSLSEYKEWMNEDIRVLLKYILYQHINNSK